VHWTCGFPACGRPVRGEGESANATKRLGARAVADCRCECAARPLSAVLVASRGASHRMKRSAASPLSMRPSRAWAGCGPLSQPCRSRPRPSSSACPSRSACQVGRGCHPPDRWDSDEGCLEGTSQRARHARITGYGVSAGRPAGKGLSRSRNVASRRRRLRGGEVDPVGPPAKSARVTRTLAQPTAARFSTPCWPRCSARSQSVVSRRTDWSRRGLSRRRADGGTPPTWADLA
jgi:hypothetical protein